MRDSGSERGDAGRLARAIKAASQINENEFVILDMCFGGITGL
jgi:hypothetical protein